MAHSTWAFSEGTDGFLPITSGDAGLATDLESRLDKAIADRRVWNQHGLVVLRNDRLVRSHRGRDGGYELARPGTEISIADVLRCIDGPLASVRDIGLGDLPYSGATAALTDVWRALRASMRSVLEQTSLADVAAGALPDHVARMADDYRDQESHRHAQRGAG